MATNQPLRVPLMAGELSEDRLLDKSLGARALFPTITNTHWKIALARRERNRVQEAIDAKLASLRAP